MNLSNRRRKKPRNGNGNAGLSTVVFLERTGVVHPDGEICAIESDIEKPPSPVNRRRSIYRLPLGPVGRLIWRDWLGSDPEDQAIEAPGRAAGRREWVAEQRRLH